MSIEKLAIDGGPVGKRQPFPAWPVHDEREIQALTEVIESGNWWRIAGTKVTQFEEQFAQYQRGQHAVAVTSGTNALELALSALNIGRQHEVILPAFTFISTATAVLCNNAVPILVDVDPVTYCLDPDAIEAAITERTRAIIPVHMAGHIANMDEISRIAQRHHLYVIEDAAHAQGAEWNGQRVGALQTGGIFSFQAGKLMTAGEGGLVLSHDAEFIERCYLFSSGGRPKTDRTYQHMLVGTTSRMSELHAAVLLVQLSRLDEQIERREQQARLLDDLLHEVAGITPQGCDPRVTRHPHYMYMFRYDASTFNGLSRQQFVDELIAEGVPAFIAYQSIHRTPVFRTGKFGPRWVDGDPLLPNYNRVHCPVSEELSDQVVWLHHRTLLGNEEDLRDLVNIIEKIRFWAGKTAARV
jgi:3-amino-5-hydroxybenzoate synthase